MHPWVYRRLPPRFPTIRVTEGNAHRRAARAAARHRGARGRRRLRRHRAHGGARRTLGRRWNVRRGRKEMDSGKVTVKIPADLMTLEAVGAVTDRIRVALRRAPSATGSLATSRLASHYADQMRLCGDSLGQGWQFARPGTASRPGRAWTSGGESDAEARSGTAERRRHDGAGATAANCGSTKSGRLTCSRRCAGRAHAEALQRAVAERAPGPCARETCCRIKKSPAVSTSSPLTRTSLRSCARP